MMQQIYDGSDCYPEIVREHWLSHPNYLIEYNEKVEKKEWCAVYFCSNDIWFPHTESIFRKRILEKNFFEWYRCRIDRAYKHIFIRDVYKQWYIKGINGEISSQEKLLDFLKKETHGFKVVTIGSSAGGYAATLFGGKLAAEQVICFNGQFCLEKAVQHSSLDCNPILFRRLKTAGVKVENILLGVQGKTRLFYVYSNKSVSDVEQHRYVEGVKNLSCIAFDSSRHGIPFLKVALPVFINLSAEEMESLSERNHHPVCFTIHCVGIWQTIGGFFRQAYNAYRKRR